jgi:hypothetical protein
MKMIPFPSLVIPIKNIIFPPIKGAYLCECVDDYNSGVIIGAMSGKDCRASGEPALVMIASNDRLLQLNMVGPRGRVNAAARAARQESDIGAVEFDPRRELMFWVDTYQRKLFRSALPKGNQSHEGQELLIRFEENISPLAMAVDYLTGNLFITAVTSSENEATAVAAGKRRKRMSEPNVNGGGTAPRQLLEDTGVIFVATSDGRYRRKASLKERVE